MPEFTPVSTLADLDHLDQDEIVQGYMYGINGGAAEPGNDKSRGFWHGWRNAMADRRVIPIDHHMRQLAEETVRKWRAH